jgi:hypothetical protein
MKKTIFILITVLAAFSLQAAVLHNDIVPVFPEGDQPKIEDAVIHGAIFFLEADSQAALLLAEYEKSAGQPLNIPVALEYAEKAIAKLEKSRDEYAKAASLAKEAGCVDSMISKFKIFNYDSYTANKQLNSDIMAVVKAYFTEGNIPGAYQQNVDNINDILLSLLQIKEKLANNQSPDISLVWQLLQQLSETSLFGNYCTITARTILEQ